MCEILIFAGNNTHPDPETDRRGCWKRGMPVMVREDGFPWASFASVRLPTFAILKLPGVPVEKAEAFLEAQMVDDAGVPYYQTTPEVNPRRSVYRRCASHLKWASLPAGVRNEIQTTGEYTTTVAAIRTYLRRIRDDSVFTGLDP